jgi:nucleotide-binding universal stress UspA family protein
MFTKVLVPLDTPEVAPGILPYVSHLAKALDLSVVLMSVIDPSEVQESREMATREVGGQSISAAAVDATDQGRQFLRGFVEALGQEGIQAESAVAVGEDPAREILQFASANGCDLIAMATHDRNLLGQAIRGSVTNEVLRSAHVPVLAVTPENQEGREQPTQLNTILAPLDGSAFAEAVLPYVEFLARSMALEVVLVRVLRYDQIYPPIVSANMAETPGTAQVLLEAESAAEQEIIDYLRDLAQRLSEPGLPVRWELLRGPVSSSIATLAQELPHSLIALASHGRSGLARWVLGSVAEELLRGTGDPVLVIPSGVAEDGEGDGT